MGCGRSREGALLVGLTKDHREPEMRQAACPSTTSPLCSGLGVGRHPAATLAVRSSSAVGSWSQTETELIAPSQVVSKTSVDPSGARKLTSCVYSS